MTNEEIEKKLKDLFDCVRITNELIGDLRELLEMHNEKINSLQKLILPVSKH